jgi:3-oxoacyl-[acyl-carrier protein] reductase
MADRYQIWTNGAIGGLVARGFGLPRPEPLRRYAPGGPLLDGELSIGGGGRLSARRLPELLRRVDLRLNVIDRDASPAQPTAYGSDTPEVGALLFDASGIESTADLAALYEFFHSRLRALRPCGRVAILGSTRSGAAQRAIEGFMRSLGKELRRGATANLVRVDPALEAEDLVSILAFLLSARSAYVSGQVLVIGPSAGSAASGATNTTAARTAVVTGAARGIGAVIAETLAREGLSVVCVDVPGQAETLREVAGRIGGEALELDITTPDAPDVLAQRGRIDVFVHNAGVLRDKTLARMTREQWDTVLTVNLRAVETITARLLDPDDPLLRSGGRIICASSIAAIAGNVGQTNYAASKAGLIGLVEESAPVVAERLGGTINAVAPGFIETQMTASVPLFIREAGRRMNSLRQGGLPIDVAEAVSFLAEPGSGGINGQTLRVCGQSLLGA